MSSSASSATLREARIRRGIELGEVERVTKIRIKYLRAIEEEQWQLLPGPAYARGFLSTYAQFLELDDRALVEEYRRRHGVAETGPIPEQMLPTRGVAGRRQRRPSGAVLAGLIAVVILGVVVIVGLLDGSPNGEDRADRVRRAEGSGGAPSVTRTSQEPPRAQPDRVSVRLRSSGTVWVCLVDDRGRALVNGETLVAGEARGEFRARAFEVTFGNGAVEMEVDDEPVDVPDLAEPLGYRITPGGVRELDPASRPTCV